MKIFVPSRFSVIRVLREDGHRKTFLGTDHLLEKSDLVVKISRKSRSDRDDLIQRLSWFAGIRHDNLGTIFDAGLTTRADLYSVREYLPSSELFSTGSVVVIKALTSAIDFLQSHGRIHGAIKPSNIFFTGGKLKLTDPNFNNVANRESEEHIRFAAPEILRGESPTLESDLYSLGAVLYRVLTRRNLFEDLDLSHLRAKYVWAVPQPIGNLSDVPKPISDTVMLLLDKEPQKRAVAFVSLKECIRAEPTRAIRAPFIGREAPITEALKFLQRPSPKSLRVLLIEGTAGIGKSRFIEELRIHCALEDFQFLVTHCSRDSSDLHPILEAVRKLGEGLNGSSRDSFPGFGFEDFQQYAVAERNYPVGKLTSNLVSALAAFARRTRLVLAIEDINKANPETLRLLEQLSFRAVEAPMCLVITSRDVRSDLKLSAMFNDCLGEEFHRIRLLPLTPGESQELTHYFDIGTERSADLLQVSGGNPLFIEEYAKSTPKSLNNDRTNTALDWMSAQITKQTKAVAEVLSLLRKPIELQVIAKILGRNIPDLEQQVSAIEDVGLIDRNGLLIRIAYPGLAKALYRRIPRYKKVDLAKRALAVLGTNNRNIEDLAYYSLEAAEFEQAGQLYHRLANEAYEKHNYRNALIFYEHLQECERRGGSQFPAAEKMNLARCYVWVGKQTQSHTLCEELLSNNSVRNDPELLSRLYGRFANIFDKTSAQERVRLSRLALECLASDSSQLVNRYLQLCSNLMKAGNLSDATDVLKKVREFGPLPPKVTDFLNRIEGDLLINLGDFRGAAETMLRSGHTERFGTLNNLALSFEHLGGLRKAYSLQSQTLRIATANGIVPAQILSLGNLGSIKTKQGLMLEAAHLFEKALTLSEQLQKDDPAFDPSRFITVQCDAALHHMQRGKYVPAAERLNTVRLFVGSLYELDKVYCGIAQCLFYRDIGFTKRVRETLELLKGSQTFKTSFFSVEHTLLDARMPDVTDQEKGLRLEQALEITEQLGTLYQRCQVLNELAGVHISIGEKQKAQEYSNSALQLARKQGYKLLEVRALLQSGIASEKQKGKEHRLLGAFQGASEMGLEELAAESAFHLGMLHLEMGNLVTAREYLSRSVSTTAKLSEEIPIRCRTNYLAVSWRRDARHGLEECNQSMQQRSMSATSDSYDSLGEDRYFKATYRLALSAAAIKSAEALILSIEETVQTSLAHGAVMLLNGPTGLITRGVRIKPTEQVMRQVHNVAAMAKNRMYFGSAEMDRQKETVAWVPLQSETWAGGIYVVCRQNEPPLTEKEIELLAIIGTTGNGALRSLETYHAPEAENIAFDEFHGMVGASKTMREVYSQIQIAARNAATVLIEGESGTGKELVAKAIHAAGARAKEPFVAVDCGAIPETLIEAELFGAKKGSYTGAVADRQGLFEAAHRGTLFLDEISNTTPALQAKLLRVIQEREVRRIGETKDRPIDVRLIVASNMNLEALAGEGRFRKDLLYRLKVFDIKLPPLRARRDDIPMIAHAFLQKLNTTNKLKKYFAPGVIDHLAAHNFPGNVRELQNAIERAFFSAKGSLIPQVPLGTQVGPSAGHDEVQSWFADLSEGRKDFWSAVRNRYKRRDISREKVVALVDLGLRTTRGSYKTLAARFHVKEKEYHRFMDFLRRNDCLLDFRPYRKAATSAP
ncbi:MAG: hypothetical protein DMG16_25830 [Acidobacteria bacterium]|nr:MAG: hypothetical protein DMG16_25830 [Acidobacteriota bacterium]